ncbi:MAG: hypothetical protein ACO31E_11280, partial [Phycisphaerales bacterium]
MSFARAGAVAIATAWCATEAHAVDRLVPSEYATIQAAINASVNGDTVIVADGVYPELIRCYGKAITLRSENGPGKAVL